MTMEKSRVEAGLMEACVPVRVIMLLPRTMEKYVEKATEFYC